MISWLHLLWIVPVAAAIGAMILAFIFANAIDEPDKSFDEREIYR